MGLDVLNGVLHGMDPLSVVVGHFKFKRLFKCRDKLDEVKVIGAQIFNQASTRRDASFVFTQLHSDKLLDFALDPVAERRPLIAAGPVWNRRFAGM